MEKAYVSEHVRKILESKEGISLLTQVVENQEKIRKREPVIVTLENKTLELRITNSLVEPKT